MKELTITEYRALGQGPHDAREVGTPPINEKVLQWEPEESEWHTTRGHGIIEGYPIWHKLPWFGDRSEKLSDHYDSKDQLGATKRVIIKPQTKLLERRQPSIVPSVLVELMPFGIGVFLAIAIIGILEFSDGVATMVLMVALCSFVFVCIVTVINLFSGKLDRYVPKSWIQRNDSNK